MPKIMVIGLDAACFNVIMPWLEVGHLPNLRKLMANGVYGELASLVPTITPPAWTSITTGTNPGKHGVFHFVKKHPSSQAIQLVTAADNKAKYIWEYISDEGLDSIVINVPLTHPPREMRGILIPGFLAPEAPTCFPPEILKEFEKEFGPYKIYPDFKVATMAAEKRLAGYLEVIKMRRDAILYYTSRYPWDFMMVEFQETDDVMHMLGDTRNALELYRCIDGCVGDITDALGSDANILLVSDHGIGKTKWTFSVNTWLREHELLETTRTGGIPLDLVIMVHMSIGMSRSNSFTDRVMAFFAGIGITLEEIDRVVSRLRLDFIRTIVPPQFRTKLYHKQIDWARSKAYCDPTTNFGITINMRGRTPYGMVEPGEEYHRLREQIIKQLQSVRDPDGELVFDSVMPREEYYHGPEIANSPDIVLFDREQSCKSGDVIRGRLFESSLGHVHLRKGLLIASGPDVAALGRLDSTPSILDIAPTVLHMMGISVPQSMEGRVLTEIFKPDNERTNRAFAPQNHHVHREANTTTRKDEQEPPLSNAQDEENVKKRLRSLGYIQ